MYNKEYFIKVFVLFALTYGAIFLLSVMNSSAQSSLPIPEMNFSKFPVQADYTIILLPVIGFFFVYLIVPYLRSEFGFGDLFVKILFPFIFILFCVLGFFLAVYFYYLDVGLRIGIGFDLSRFGLDYMRLFLSSPFFYFMLAGIGGWASRRLIEKFESK